MVSGGVVAGISAFVLLIGAAGLVGSGIYLPSVIQAGLDDAVRLPTSEEDESFDTWETNNQPDALPIYEKYYLFNLTNPDAVLGGATPIMDEIGPFVYRLITTKENVEFKDDGNMVTYQPKTFWTFDPDQSFAGEDVLITGFNPAWQTIDDNIHNSLVGLGLASAVDQFKRAAVTIGTLQNYQALTVGPANIFSQVANLTHAPARTNANLGLTTTFYLEYKGFCDAIACGVEISPAVMTGALYYDPVTNPLGIFDATGPLPGANAMAFLGEMGVAMPNFTYIDLVWGLDPSQAQMMAGWLSHNAVGLMPDLGGGSTTAGLGGETINNWITTGRAGLISKRNVNEWLFDFTDPMLAFFTQSTGQAAVNGKLNNTLLETQTVMTGKSDIDRSEELVMWHGEDHVTWDFGLTSYDVKLSTYPATLGTRTKTNQDRKSEEKAFVWAPNPERALWLQGFAEEIQVNGIDTTVFRSDPNMFLSAANHAPNAEFGHDRDGYIRLTGAADGAPLFLSKARFLDTPLAGRVDLGAEYPASKEEHDSFAAAELKTGLVLESHVRLQNNIEINSTPQYYPTVSTVMTPWFWLDFSVVARENDTEQLATALSLLGTSTIGAFAGAALAGLGLIGVIAGCTMSPADDAATGFAK